MFERARGLCVILSIGWALLVADATRAAEPAQFGFSRVDVTPEKPLRLSGYGSRSEPFEGIEQRLWARSMAVRIGEGPVHVLTTVDTLGFPGAMTTSIARRIQKEHGIGRKHFALSGTHSHTAPHLSGGPPNLFSTPLTKEEEAATRQYTEWLADRVVESVEGALGDLKPGQMTYGLGKVGFASNRRVLSDGRWTGFGVNPSGPVDHSLPVLKVVAPNGQLRGLVFNYACHCTTLGGDFNRVSGDWAGYATQYLEETHPGAVALCTIGCGADANPEPRGKLPMAEAHGRAVALEVVRVIQDEMQTVDDEITSSFGYAGLPVDRPSLEKLRKRLDHDVPQYRQHAQRMLAIHKRMGRLPETYPMPIQTWRFGSDLTMVFLGGEVVVDYAHRLRQEIDDSNVWISAYTNDVFAYVASERVRQEGGYEVDRSMIYYNQPGPWAEGTEDVVIQRVHDILQNPEGEGALPPDAALKTFRLPPGFDIEPVATEPLIADPVNIAFGPDGRLWVVEMGDYPRGTDGQGGPGGRIRILEDTDGDGRFDTSTIFLDGLRIPNGVMPWREGALVSCAPDVFYAEDTDGDGRADRRTVLFTGFPEANPQHRINGFAYGLDHWVYLGSDTGGTIRSERTGQVVNMSGRDLRIQPDEGLHETVSGRTQFGRTRDDWGNWFGGSNSHPMYHFVISDRYLRRNPYVAAPNPRVELILPSPAPPVFPTSRTVDRFNDLFAANRFTSACSPIVFRDPALGPDVEGAAFVCEPVHNLVHRSLLKRSGVTFAAERHPDERQSEFLSSTDTWSRPVRVATGPDGALWVVDMYRQVIEHPEWIPEEWQQRLDLRAGHNRGRIYRVYRSGQRPGPLPDLAAMSVADLVAQLESPNGWRRDMAQQLLVHRADEEAVPQLVELAKNGDTSLGRLHALCTLDGMAKLDAAVLRRALEDTDPRVQRRAVLLTETRLAENPSLGSALLALIEHPDIRVRYQLALSLGEWDDPRAGQALGRLAVADLGNAWIRAGVLSSAVPHASDMLTIVASHPDSGAEWSRLMEQLVATALGGDFEANLVNVLATICKPRDEVAPWQVAAFAGFVDAIERRGLSLSKLHQRNDALRPHLEVAAKIIEVARDTVQNADSPLSQRCLATRLLGRGKDRQEEDAQQLTELLTPQTPPSLQESAILALAATRSRDVPDRLLRGWRSYSPNVQSEVLNVLLSRPEWSEALLDALQGGTIRSADLDAATRSRLVAHKSEATRERAQQLLSTTADSARQDVVNRYQAALDLNANWIRGAAVFNRRCATCHRFRGRGQEIGPQLAALQDKSGPSLLVAILDPNRAVEQKYRSYVAATNDGRLYDGLVIEESSTSVTLARQTGRQDVLLRNELEEFSSTGKSFMPEGLEQDLSPQDLADVIAFLQSRTRSAESRESESPESARKLLADAGNPGVTRLLAVPTRREFSSWMGPVIMPTCEAHPQARALRWESAPWTQSGSEGQPVVLRAAAAMGVGALDAEFELHVNGQASVRFVPTTEDASWASENDRVRLRYLAVESSDDHSSGLLEIELPWDALKPGRTVTWTVQPPATDGGGWFGLLPLNTEEK